jgi:hypothetical protein
MEDEADAKIRLWRHAKVCQAETDLRYVSRPDLTV